MKRQGACFDVRYPARWGSAEYHPAAVQQLGIEGREEIVVLRTIRHYITELKGQSIDLLLSPQSRPEEKNSLTGLFTAPLLTLTEQTYPAKRRQQCYHHLRAIPVPSFDRVQPLFLIGSTYSTLITPKEPIKLGPAGGPVALWMLPHQVSSLQCLFTSLTPLHDPIYQHRRAILAAQCPSISQRESDNSV